MKTFNCSGTLRIRMNDLEIEADTEEKAREEFIEACIEEADWYGELTSFDCTEIEEVKDE